MISAVGVQTIGSYGLLTFKTEILDASELNVLAVSCSDEAEGFYPTLTSKHTSFLFFILWPFDPSTKLQRVTCRLLHKDTRLMWPWLPQIKTDFKVIHFHRLSCRTLISAQCFSLLSPSLFLSSAPPTEKVEKDGKKIIDLSHRLEKILRTCLLIPAFIFLSPLFIPLLVFWPWQITQPAFISPFLSFSPAVFINCWPLLGCIQTSHTHTHTACSIVNTFNNKPSFFCTSLCLKIEHLLIF